LNLHDVRFSIDSLLMNNYSDTTDIVTPIARGIRPRLGRAGRWNTRRKEVFSRLQPWFSDHPPGRENRIRLLSGEHVANHGDFAVHGDAHRSG
jgi:hypothetical protein